MPTSPSLPTFHAWGIVRHMGGATVLHRKMAVLGFDPCPPVETIRKWIRRNSIPAEWLAAILSLAKAEGRPLDLYQFLAERS